MIIKYLKIRLLKIRKHNYLIINHLQKVTEVKLLSYSMNKKITFSLTTTWILLSRAYDALCTYQYTPDLSHEANPLVSVLGMTWGPLLLVIGLLCIYSIYAYYRSVFEDFSLAPTEKGYSFNHFMGYVYIGRKCHWLSSLYRLPTSAKRFHHYMGHLFSRCLDFAGVVSTIMWLLINYTDFYMKQWHSTTFIYSLLAVGCTLICYQWLWRMYQAYKLRG